MTSVNWWFLNAEDDHFSNIQFESTYTGICTCIRIKCVPHLKVKKYINTIAAEYRVGVDVSTIRIRAVLRALVKGKMSLKT